MTIAFPGYDQVDRDAPYRWVHPDDREAHRRAVQRSFAGGDFEDDIRWVVPGLGTRWLTVRWRCEFDSDGKPLRLHGVSIDITRRRQAEEAALLRGTPPPHLVRKTPRRQTVPQELTNYLSGDGTQT